MGAYALGEEGCLGTFEGGKFADIAVINGRVIDEEPKMLLEKEFVMTMMDGKIVYEV